MYYVYCIIVIYVLQFKLLQQNQYLDVYVLLWVMYVYYIILFIMDYIIMVYILLWIIFYYGLYYYGLYVSFIYVLLIVQGYWEWRYLD